MTVNRILKPLLRVGALHYRGLLMKQDVSPVYEARPRPRPVLDQARWAAEEVPLQGQAVFLLAQDNPSRVLHRALP